MTILKNQMKTVLLLGALSALLVGIGALVAPGQLYLFATLALVMNLGAYFFSDKLVLAMHRAREIGVSEDPELHAMVAELAERAGIPKPRVFVIPEAQPNAFATGRNPRHGVVAVTEGIMSLLDRRELRGVLAHELGHIKNRDILVSTLAAVGASMVSYLGHALSFGALFGGSRDSESSDSGSADGGILVALVAPLAATLVQLGISRSREYLADATGAEISGDPEALARALLKLERASEVVPASEPRPATASLFIVNPFGAMESTMRLFSTHPSTAERVRRLRAMAEDARAPRGSHHSPRSALQW
jgi:heat shock protein HtpX